MRLMYMKPKLKDLSQGLRIAFARQLRLMSQDDFSDKLGLDGENKRRTMTNDEELEFDTEEKLEDYQTLINLIVTQCRTVDFQKAVQEAMKIKTEYEELVKVSCDATE